MGTSDPQPQRTEFFQLLKEVDSSLNLQMRAQVYSLISAFWDPEQKTPSSPCEPKPDLKNHEIIKFVAICSIAIEN